MPRRKTWTNAPARPENPPLPLPHPGAVEIEVQPAVPVFVDGQLRWKVPPGTELDEGLLEDIARLNEAFDRAASAKREE